MMTDFNIRRGLSSVLFSEPGKVNPNLVIEEGCWYLCTDTAELYLSVQAEGKLTLKRINNVDLSDLDFVTIEELNKYVEDAIKNAELSGGEGVDLSDYAKKEDLPTKVSDLANDAGYLTYIPNEYITAQELNNKGYITAAEVPKTDLTDYAKKSEIPVVPIKVSAFENDKGYITDISSKADIDHTHTEYADTEHTHTEYATKEELPSLEGYAKTSELFSGSYEDLTNKPEIPNIAGLASEEFVNQKIAEAELADKDVDLGAYYTKSEVNSLIDNIELKEGPAGADGKDGVTPEIIDGYWYINGESTGVKAESTDGTDGKDGTNGIDGKDGQNGVTPHIGENGNWFIGDEDTEVKAQGADGKDGENGYTPVKGVDYFDGVNGKDGLTTTIKVGETTYTHTDGVITLPAYYTKVQVDTVQAALATKEYVDTAISEHANLATKEKADNVPFIVSTIVSKAVGGFEGNEDIKDWSIAKILAKLLGFTYDEPSENPDVPQDVTIEDVKQNNIPVMQGSISTSEGSVANENSVSTFKYLAIEEDARNEAPQNADPGTSAFYEIKNASGEVVEHGYQIYTISSGRGTYFRLALPQGIKMKSVEYYDDGILHAWVPYEVTWTETEERPVFDGYTYVVYQSDTKSSGEVLRVIL